MIGNDIVDFKAASVESNWRRKGFLDKLFCDEEQELILSSSQPEKQLWTLWAMKEAAYKAHQRRFRLPRSFNPKSLTATLYTAEKGKVSTGEADYHLSVSANPFYVHCLARTSASEKILNKIHEGGGNNKAHFLKTVADLKQLPEKKLNLKKDSRNVPFLTCENQRLNLNFSFSGHGNFSAYALALMNC